MDFIKLKIRRHKESVESAELDFFMDTGMAFAVVPEKVLCELGIEPSGKEGFGTSAGEWISRKAADVYFEYEGRGGCARVLFGEERDAVVAGRPTLAALGLFLHPFTRELLELRAAGSGAR